MNSPSPLSPLAFSEYSVLSEFLSVLWPPHGSGSFSCKSDAAVSSEGKLTLWVFKKETLFVLPRLLSSSEISKSLILALFLPAFDAAAFFSLDLSSSFRKSVKDIWRLHQLREVNLSKPHWGLFKGIITFLLAELWVLRSKTGVAD